ncbi:MAG: GtrA family protein [Clostridia bacterium]|nr:GtrA family protein [Clostridia bacterium]
MEKIKGLLQDKEKMRELIVYVLFGVLTTVVNWVIYTLLTTVLGMTGYPEGSASYVLIGNAANAVAWIISVLFAFFTNKRYVFKSEKTRENGAWKEFGLFVSARVLSYLLFDLGLYTLCLFFLPHQVDKILMNVLVVIFNYLASKLVVFRKKA